MTYLKHFSRKGESTKLISARIQMHNVEFANDNCFVFGRFINAVLETLVHDLQTDYNIKNEKYWLTASGSLFTGYKEDLRGSIPKMIRVRCDLLEYLQMNMYKVNTAINLACDRWIDYFKSGQVAEYYIRELTDHKKADRDKHRNS